MPGPLPLALTDVSEWRGCCRTPEKLRPPGGVNLWSYPTVLGSIYPTTDSLSRLERPAIIVASCPRVRHLRGMYDFQRR